MRRLNFIVPGIVLILSACNFSPSPTGDIIVPSVATPAEAVQEPIGDGARPAALSAEQVLAISQATVQVIAAQDTLQPIETGSGVLVSADGQIATNCHIACGAPVLLILMTTTIDQPPQALYRAEVTSFDESLDLALLQINQDVNGNPVIASTLSLPFLQRGDSNAVTVGEPVRVFGYSGISGTTVTFTSGTVTGIENSTVSGVEQPAFLKTDAEISSGFSGGAAVDLFGRLIAVSTTLDPDVREGVTLGSIGLLLPVNLITQLNIGAPPELSGSKLPPQIEPDDNEPNNTFEEAAGPLIPGQTIEGYISYEDDTDVFVFDTNTSSAISVSLTNIPAGVDYDIYVYSSGKVVAKSENEASADEMVDFSPSSPGRFFVAVSSFGGISGDQPYSLAVNFDGGKATASSVNLTGTVINGTTGQPFEGGVFGVLNAGVTCTDFFGGASLNMGLVINTATTDVNGNIILSGVPTGEVYGAFFFFGSDHVCQNGWLDVPADGGDIDIGTITLSF